MGGISGRSRRERAQFGSLRSTTMMRFAIRLFGRCATPGIKSLKQEPARKRLPVPQNFRI